MGVISLQLRQEARQREQLARDVARILDLDLPPSLLSEPEAELEDLDAELAFVFDELLAPPDESTPKDSSRQTGSGSLTLFPPAGVSDLWLRR